MEELEQSSAIELIQDRLDDLKSRRIQLQAQMEKDLLAVLMPIDTSIRELRGLLGQLGVTDDETVPQYKLVKRTTTPTPPAFAPVQAAQPAQQPSQTFQPVATAPRTPPKELPAPSGVMGTPPAVRSHRKLDHNVQAIISPDTGTEVTTNNAILRMARKASGNGQE